MGNTKVIAILLILLLVIIAIIAFIWLVRRGEKLLLKKESGQNAEEKVLKKRRPIFTGDDIWEIEVYHKKDKVAPYTLEVHLLDCVYGEKRYVHFDAAENKIIIETNNELKKRKVKVTRTLYGYVKFEQDEGLIFEKYKKNTPVRVLSSDIEQPVKRFKRFEDGMKVFLGNEWTLAFTKKPFKPKEKTEIEGQAFKADENGKEITLDDIAIESFKLYWKVVQRLNGVKEPPKEENKIEVVVENGDETEID